MTRSILNTAIALSLSLGLAFPLMTASDAHADEPTQVDRDYNQHYAHASGNDFGLGLMVGPTSGLAGKLFMGRSFALAFGLGSMHDGIDYHNHGTVVQADALWHPAMLIENRDVALPLYFGVGGRVGFHEHDHDGVIMDDTVVGVRAPVGVALEFQNAPVDIFTEISLGIDVTGDLHGGDTYLAGALGGRFYF